MNVRALACLALIAALCGGAAAGQPAAPEGWPEALLVVSGAEDPFFSQASQVSYWVPGQQYPAAALIETLSDALESGGWKKVDHDPLNPESGGEMHAWSAFEDWSVEPATKVDQWIGWFARSESEFVMLVLLYVDREKGGPEAKSVQVMITHQDRAQP